MSNDAQTDPRKETRRDRIATIVQEGHRDRLTSDQVAARIDAMLAREITAPGLTLNQSRDIAGQ